MKHKNKIEPLVIADKVIKPGSREMIEIPIATLYTHTQMELPVHVIHGKKQGPRLFVCAAIHGDEINGVEIIRRLFVKKTLHDIQGTLIAVPVVNTFGLIQHSRYLPDRRDLNRSFPGSEKGSLASRLAYIFMQTIVSTCEYGIDIHTGAQHRDNLPQIRAKLDDDETKELARAFGVPVIINSDVRDGSLREAAASKGVKMLLYEAGEALRFDELAIKAGVRGIVQVMRHLGMLKPSRRTKELPEPFIAKNRYWVRAPHSGILRTTRKLGDYVEKDQVLGTISDPTAISEYTEFKVIADRAGIIIGKTNLPLVNEGDAIYHIAYFADDTEVAQEVEYFQQDLV